MKSILLFVTTCFISLGLQAQETYVDLRAGHISGEVIDVPAPNVLHIKTKKDGEYKTFYVEIIHVDFGDERNISCKSQTKTKNIAGTSKYKFRTVEVLNPGMKESCDRMDGWLNGKQVHIDITEWVLPITKGFVFVGSTNINYELISRGWYRVDYTQSRDASLVLLEKEARCQRVGIWEAKMGIPEEDMKCQD